MASRLLFGPSIARGLAAARSTPARRLPAAAFHSTPAAYVKAGDALPSVDLAEGAPDKKVNLGKELGSGSGKALIIGVPAAFSPTCSDSHVPGYIAHPSLRDAGKVFVVSVNDPFVMNAWGKSLDAGGTSGIRFLADSTAAFSKALDLAFDASGVLGGVRGKRYALVVKDGKVISAHVEPDNIGHTVSSAEKVLASL